MIVTEEQAKELWCPMGRYLAIFRDETGKRECAGSYNRGAGDSGLNNSNCIGSRCMWWEWYDGEPLTDVARPYRRGQCGAKR